MFTHSLTLALNIVCTYSLLIFGIILILMLLTFLFKSNGLGFITLVLERFALGLFGLFECRTGGYAVYSYAWVPIRSHLIVAVLVYLGICILSAHVAVSIWLFWLGVTSIITLASPIITYLIYPLTLYILR